MDRRSFLPTTAAATLTSAAAAPQLAVDGGTPVRSQPLSTANWGPLYYDDKEQTELDQVLQGRKPFRFANPPDKSKVAIFENEFAGRMQTKYEFAVTSGTAALHTAVAALEVGPGDE